MTQDNQKIEEIKNFPHRNYKLLCKILQILKENLKGKRKITYYDILNYIVREGFHEEEYNHLILWCNYKIRCEEIFIEF